MSLMKLSAFFYTSNRLKMTEKCMATDLENQMHKALTQPAAYRYLRADLFFRLANRYRYFSQTHEIINLNYILYDFTEKKKKTNGNTWNKWNNCAY